MREKRLPDYQCFYYYLSDLLLELFGVMTHLLKISEYSSERSLVALIIIVLIFILLKLVVVLVYSIVCEMHVQVVHVVIIRHLILFG